MCQNKFEYFLLGMHDKIIHNPKICLGLRGHSVTPFDPVTIHRPLGWSNWPLGSISTTLRTTDLNRPKPFTNFEKRNAQRICVKR